MRLFKAYNAIFVVFFLLFAAIPLHAELLSGSISAMGNGEGSFVLERSGTNEKVPVQLAPELLFERPNGSSLPGCVCLHNPVKVWGEFQEDGTVFVGTKIRGSGQHKDPTGVRSRLGKGCRLHDRNHSGDGVHR